MQDLELINLVITNLNLTDGNKDLVVSDVIQEVKNYCNLKELPIELEPFIRKKVKTIIQYETENSGPFDVKSIKEGDTSITYNVNENYNRDTIYSLSNVDKKALQVFRRLKK